MMQQLIKDILADVLPKGRFWTHSKTLVEGCTKVSPGCRNCWAEAIAKRFMHPHKATAFTNFSGTVWEMPGRLADIVPVTNRRKPRVWTYWNDVFHEGVSYDFRCKLFSHIILAPNDYHIICTKRPYQAVMFLNDWKVSRPLANVIIMVSIEDQQRMNSRWPNTAKLATMGWNVGLLCEPLLEPLNLCLDIWPVLPKWIICGPENGHGKRPFDGQWAMRLQAQAKAAGVPFFYKAGLLNGKEYLEVPA